MKLAIKFIGLSLILFSTISIAASPVGLWKTIDDKTGKPRSIVRISEANGTLSVAIEKGLRDGDNGDKVCEKCTDERKGQKLWGMVIAKDLKETEPNLYENGKILDPDNGKEYKCKMKLSEDGNKLEVRGFIGFSLLGRTQTWVREE